MNDYERNRIKNTVESLRDINYFDCVDRPSFTQREAREAADCIEELAASLGALENKLEEYKDLSERRLRRKNMYKDRSERDFMLYLQYKTLLHESQEKLAEVESKLSELLSYMTGGRFSKTTYSIEEMKRFIDDYQQDMCAKCDEVLDLKTELEKVKYETEQHL